jgi:hypothetical protein
MSRVVRPASSPETAPAPPGRPLATLRLADAERLAADRRASDGIAPPLSMRAPDAAPQDPLQQELADALERLEQQLASEPPAPRAVSAPARDGAWRHRLADALNGIEDDILELTVAEEPRPPAKSDNTWAAEVDRALQRRLAEAEVGGLAAAFSVESVSASPETAARRAAHEMARAASTARRRRRSDVVHGLVLAGSGVALAGIVGLGAYLLSSAEAKAWFVEVWTWIEQVRRIELTRL